MSTSAFVWTISTLFLLLPCGDMAAEFDFDLWLSHADLTSDSVDKLVCVKVRDLDSLCLLSQYDVTALKFEIGDRGKFRRALRKLREQYPDEDEDVLNASTSTKPDDSFDGSDPEQVALQQRLKQEQSHRALAAQLPSASGVNTSQLPVGEQSLLLPIVSSVRQPSTNFDQLSSLLASMNLKLTSTIAQFVNQPQNLPFALADPPQSLQHLITNCSSPYVNSSSSIYYIGSVGDWSRYSDYGFISSSSGSKTHYELVYRLNC
jgi:hypothetical protein